MHPGIISVTYGYLPNGTTLAEAESMISQYNTDRRSSVDSATAAKMTDIIPPSLSAPLSRFRPTCLVLVAHTMLQCETVPGYGAGVVFVVRVGGLISLVQEESPFTSYITPSVSGVTGDGAFNASTRGSQLVLISGAQLGSRDL